MFHCVISVAIPLRGTICRGGENDVEKRRKQKMKKTALKCTHNSLKNKTFRNELEIEFAAKKRRQMTEDVKILENSARGFSSRARKNAVFAPTDPR